MHMFNKITPEGTKDYLFEECRAREAARHALSEVFESYGYAPIATPHLEFFDVFRGETSDWLGEKFYSVTDSRGRLLVMRPDSTLPIARVAATRLQNEALPLRLYYHQSVFRRARVYTGRRDEMMQSGVEFLGAKGMRADLEIISCAVDALQRCEAPRFHLELGHAGIFASLVDSLGIKGEAREALIHAIKTKNVPSLQALLEPYNSHEAQALLALPKLFGGAEVFRKARQLLRAPAACKALKYLQELYENCKALGFGDCVDIDLGLVHGQQYYTGLVFRGYIEGSGKRVLSGGRYDKMLAQFGRPAAAVGFALSLDPLAEALLENGKLSAKSAAEVLVFGAAGQEAEALTRCRELRAQGITCECAPVEALEDAREYAQRRGIARVETLNET